MPKYRVFLCVVPVLVASLVLCERQPPGQVVARVGNSVLTLEELYRSIPPEYTDKITREQNIDYVKQWINTELLYQEAMKRRIDHEQSIRERLRKMRRDLLSAEMVTRIRPQAMGQRISNDSIAAYYRRHSAEFVRDRDMVRFQEIAVENPSAGRDLLRSARSGNSPLLGEQNSYAPTSSAALVPLDGLPPALRNAIAATPIGGDAGPIKTNRGYSVIRVIDKLEKGGICREEEVRDEIASRLSAQAQNDDLERMIGDLRLRTVVDLDLGLIPGAAAPPAPETGSLSADSTR